MGGFGSGNWHRQRSHETVGALPELFAIDFKNPSGEVVAKPRDELSLRVVTYRYVRSGQDVVLFRSGPPHNINTVTIEPLLRIDSTPCYFGGARNWLCCPMPSCERRVQSLFVNGRGGIGCRKCLELLYESQYGGRIERKLSRLRVMHRKILREGSNQSMLVQQAQQEFQSLLSDLKKIDRADSCRNRFAGAAGFL